MDNEPKKIYTWKQLSKEKSETHILEIDIMGCNGWIKPNPEVITDVESPEYYLSTHTFYGKTHEHSTKVLQHCGFNVVIANWDEKSEEQLTYL